MKCVARVQKSLEVPRRHGCMGCTYFNCFTFLVRDLSFATPSHTRSSMSSYLLQVKSDSRSTTCEGACNGPIHKGGPAKPQPAPRATRLLFLTASSSPSPEPDPQAISCSAAAWTPTGATLCLV